MRKEHVLKVHGSISANFVFFFMSSSTCSLNPSPNELSHPVVSVIKVSGGLPMHMWVRVFVIISSFVKNNLNCNVVYCCIWLNCAYFVALLCSGRRLCVLVTQLKKLCTDIRCAFTFRIKTKLVIRCICTQYCNERLKIQISKFHF